MTHFSDVRKLSYLKHKFASVDTTLNECYVVCDKNNLLVKETVQPLLRMWASPSGGGAWTRIVEIIVMTVFVRM